MNENRNEIPLRYFPRSFWCFREVLINFLSKCLESFESLSTVKFCEIIRRMRNKLILIITFWVVNRSKKKIVLSLSWLKNLLRCFLGTSFQITWFHQRIIQARASNNEQLFSIFRLGNLFFLSFLRAEINSMPKRNKLHLQASNVAIFLTQFSARLFHGLSSKISLEDLWYISIKKTLSCRTTNAFTCGSYSMRMKWRSPFLEEVFLYCFVHYAIPNCCFQYFFTSNVDLSSYR